MRERCALHCFPPPSSLVGRHYRLVFYVLSPPAFTMRASSGSSHRAQEVSTTWNALKKERQEFLAEKDKWRAERKRFESEAKEARSCVLKLRAELEAARRAHEDQLREFRKQLREAQEWRRETETFIEKTVRESQELWSINKELKKQLDPPDIVAFRDRFSACDTPPHRDTPSIVAAAIIDSERPPVRTTTTGRPRLLPSHATIGPKGRGQRRLERQSL